ncbi:hypothetical protein E1B28_001127 [Marasmius oreades]|uniref:N-acetyltransferase domain-containing protein n=1 Tax=Marasmius oreades TaxID=181124 RepID=A0A9P8AEV1_9AGAR|nr:uncharacterized protein E1B28_001127 [Marasmius oreades]KAG7099266.1 hypothetical protein E1B28_001127 [Marasmius oreades]
MSPPAGEIRSYKGEDEKPIRFMITKARMEGLATANKKATLHPLTLGVWLALVALLVQYMNRWPKPGDGILAFVSALPIFACTIVPIIALIDWLNRPYFEEAAQEILRGPDIPDMLDYYARSPASAAWVLEFNGQIVGVVAVDASMDSEILENLSSARRNAKGTSKTAVIRHFYVEEPYRKVDIQRDLLQHALRHTFTPDSKVQEIKTTCSSLTGYIQRCLKDEGFTLESTGKSLGVYKWKTGIWRLGRDRFGRK